MRYLELLILGAALFGSGCGRHVQTETEPEKPRNIIYGIDADGYTLSENRVQSGQTWGAILDEYSIGGQKVAVLDGLAREECPLRTIRQGQKYTAFLRTDSLGSHLDYMVYEKNAIDYAVFSFVGDSVSFHMGHKPVKTIRRKVSARIESSLWGAIIRENLPYSLASELEDIYQWTVDFFSINKGDEFTVIYDEQIVDTVSVGISRIYGARFLKSGKEVYAIPFRQQGKLSYWEADGTSLRKMLLKAPLKYTRISSTFSNARFHPVLHVYKAHHGVDYAAPVGTPVRAVAEGTVISMGYNGAAGNMVKIKHPAQFQSAYLHLKGYAKGLRTGKHVSQGELIGYVGSTGRSTGPHLDFRLWKSRQAINPLKVPQVPSEPVAKGDMEEFNRVKELVMAELQGEVPDSMKLSASDPVFVK